MEGDALISNQLDITEAEHEADVIVGDCKNMLSAYPFVISPMDMETPYDVSSLLWIHLDA